MISELRKAIYEIEETGREIEEIIVDEALLQEELDKNPVSLPPGTEINKVYGYPLKTGDVNRFEIVLKSR